MVTVTTSAACWAAAGLNVSSTIKTDDARITVWINEAEAELNTQTNFDWITNYGNDGLENFSGALSAVVAANVANRMIKFDMSGYTSRFEAVTLLNVNDRTMVQNIARLKEVETRETIGVQ